MAKPNVVTKRLAELGSLDTQAALIRRHLPGLRKKYVNDQTGIIGLSMGPRVRKGSFDPKEMTIKAYVEKKLASPAHPIDKTFTLRSRSQLAKDNGARYWEVPVDVVAIGIDTVEMCDEPSVIQTLDHGHLGMMSAYLHLGSDHYGWLTAAHVISPRKGNDGLQDGVTIRDTDQPSFGTPDGDTCWLFDSETGNYRLDVGYVTNPRWRDAQDDWPCSRFTGFVRKDDLSYDEEYYFLDQFDTDHRLKYASSFDPGVVPYEDVPGTFYPEVYAFYSRDNGSVPVGGDSGGPVWAERNGHKLLVGVLSAAHYVETSPGSYRRCLLITLFHDYAKSHNYEFSTIPVVTNAVG